MSTTTANPTTAGEMTKPELVEYLKAHDAYAGHSRDTVEQMRTLVADHQALAQLAEQAAAEANGTTDDDLSDMERGELYQRAKADHDAASKAKKANKPIPPTPYLDELNRRNAAGQKGPSKSKATTTPRVTDPRYTEADQAKEKGGRGDTRKLTPDELDAYVAKVRKAHPDGTCAGELKVARHLDGVSVSLARWNDAWKRHG